MKNYFQEVIYTEHNGNKLTAKCTMGELSIEFDPSMESIKNAQLRLIPNLLGKLQQMQIIPALRKMEYRVHTAKFGNGYGHIIEFIGVRT